MTSEIALNPFEATHSGIAGRLFCFPHAGGAGEKFQDWTVAFAPVLDVRTITLPGRGSLIDRNPITDWTRLIESVVARLMPLTDRPFALFGHSFGALVAYEAARALEAFGKFPGLLAVAGRAPTLVAEGPALSTLPKRAFLKRLAEMNGTPAEVLANEDLMGRLLPALRADFTLLESYDARAAQAHSPLRCPILALGADRDGHVPLGSIIGWRERTHRRFDCRIFAGDHFFPFTNPDFADAIFDYIDGSLNEHTKDLHRAG